MISFLVKQQNRERAAVMALWTCRNGIEVGSQYQTIEDVLKQAAEQTGDA